MNQVKIYLRFMRFMFAIVKKVSGWVLECLTGTVHTQRLCNEFLLTPPSIVCICNRRGSDKGGGTKGRSHMNELWHRGDMLDRKPAH